MLNKLKEVLSQFQMNIKFTNPLNELLLAQPKHRRIQPFICEINNKAYCLDSK